MEKINPWHESTKNILPISQALYSCWKTTFNSEELWAGTTDKNFTLEQPKYLHQRKEIFKREKNKTKHSTIKSWNGQATLQEVIKWVSFFFFLQILYWFWTNWDLFNLPSKQPVDKQCWEEIKHHSFFFFEKCVHLREIKKKLIAPRENIYILI